MSNRSRSGGEGVSTKDATHGDSLKRQPTTRKYTERTLKLLFGFSGNRCAFPDCDVQLAEDATQSDPAVVIGEICHIVAASSDGPRGSDSYSGDIDGYENLILLCPTHHTKVDKQANSYRSDDLRRWKSAQNASVRTPTARAESTAQAESTSVVRAIRTLAGEIRLLDQDTQGRLTARNNGDRAFAANGVRVSPDATVVGALWGNQLRVGGLSQLGTVVPWERPFALTELGASSTPTTLLAVARKGSRSIHCLLSSLDSTYVVRLWADGAARLDCTVSDEPSSAGVWWDERALLVQADPLHQRVCAAFPGLVDIAVLDAARWGRQLVVMACGVDDMGSVAVHVNGRLIERAARKTGAFGLIHPTDPATTPVLAAPNGDELWHPEFTPFDPWRTNVWA